MVVCMIFKTVRFGNTTLVIELLFIPAAKMYCVNVFSFPIPNSNQHKNISSVTGDI